jgi:hypothetical protein
MQPFDTHTETLRRDAIHQQEEAKKNLLPHYLLLLTTAVDDAISMATELYLHAEDAHCYIYFGTDIGVGKIVSLPSDFRRHVSRTEIDNHLNLLSESRPYWQLKYGMGGDMDYWYIFVSRM